MAVHKITRNEAVYWVVYLLLSSIIMCCNFFFPLVQNGSLHQKDTVHDNDFEPYLSGQSNQVSVFLTFFFLGHVVGTQFIGCVKRANSLNRNGKRSDWHIVLLRNTSACAHPTNATVHVQMATSENEVNAPTTVC